MQNRLYHSLKSAPPSRQNEYLAVRPGAPPGPRSLYLTQGDQRAVLTGCIEVTGP